MYTFGFIASVQAQNKDLQGIDLIYSILNTDNNNILYVCNMLKLITMATISQ